MNWCFQRLSTATFPCIAVLLMKFPGLWGKFQNRESQPRSQKRQGWLIRTALLCDTVAALPTFFRCLGTKWKWQLLWAQIPRIRHRLKSKTGSPFFPKMEQAVHLSRAASASSDEEMRAASSSDPHCAPTKV